MQSWKIKLKLLKTAAGRFAVTTLQEKNNRTALILMLRFKEECKELNWGHDVCSKGIQN